MQPEVQRLPCPVDAWQHQQYLLDSDLTVNCFQLDLVPEPKVAPAALWELAAQVQKPAAGIVAQAAVEEAGTGAGAEEEEEAAEQAPDAAASAVVAVGHANLKVDAALAAGPLAAGPLAAGAKAHAAEAWARFAACSN